MTKNHVPDDDPSGTVVFGDVPAQASKPAHRADPGPEQPARRPERRRRRIVPGPIVPGDAAASDATAAAVARLAEPDLPTAERRRALGEIVAGLRQPRVQGHGPAQGRHDVGGRHGGRRRPPDPGPQRSRRLRAHFPGLTDMQIADRLVRNAARTSAGIGVVGGGVSSLQWAAPPTLLTAPALLAAETVAVVAVEIKLIGELQELYGQPVTGGQAERAISLLQAWAGRRGVSLMVPGRGVAAVLGTAARHELRDRLVRRFGRNLTTLGPLLHRGGRRRLPQPAGHRAPGRGGPSGPGRSNRRPSPELGPRQRVSIDRAPAEDGASA